MVFSNTVDQKASEHCKSSDHKAQLRFEKYLLSLFIQITIKSAFLEEVWIALVMHKWLHAYSKECSNVICGWPLNPIWKHLLNFWYRMVGNFCEVFIFAFFASQEPFAKIKTAKICCPRVKRTNRVSIPGLLLYSTLQKRVSECAFDGYHWSNPKCYVNTDARSRQWRKAENGSNRRGSQIHQSWKLKPRKFLKSEFWPISRKFVLPTIRNVLYTSVIRWPVIVLQSC